mgnify:CR=1 FL=1
MRTVYKNPKELATCLKDIVDNYYEDLITYEDMAVKIMKIVNSNMDEIYKEKAMSTKISNIIGQNREEKINKIVEENR